MKNYKIVVMMVLIMFLSACVSQTKRKANVYTHQEYNKMTVCIGMADTAKYVASRKLGGVTKAKMKGFYKSKPNSQLNLATVDKVYSEKFKSTWDYTVGFFNECAQNLASVPPARVKFASYCSQNSLIADVAYGYKSSGKAKDKAYAHFVKLKGKTPNSIIDSVYASSKNRSAIKLDVWNNCMAKISD